MTVFNQVNKGGWEASLTVFNPVNREAGRPLLLSLTRLTGRLGGMLGYNPVNREAGRHAGLYPSRCICLPTTLGYIHPPPP